MREDSAVGWTSIHNLCFQRSGFGQTLAPAMLLLPWGSILVVPNTKETLLCTGLMNTELWSQRFHSLRTDRCLEANRIKKSTHPWKQRCTQSPGFSREIPRDHSGSLFFKLVPPCVVTLTIQQGAAVFGEWQTLIWWAMGNLPPFMTTTVPRMSCVQICCRSPCLFLAAKMQIFCSFFYPFCLFLCFWGFFLGGFLLVPLHLLMSVPLHSLCWTSWLPIYMGSEMKACTFLINSAILMHFEFLFGLSKEKIQSSSYYNQHLLQADPSSKILVRWLTSPRIKDSLFKNFALQIGISVFLCHCSSWKC